LENRSSAERGTHDDKSNQWQHMVMRDSRRHHRWRKWCSCSLWEKVLLSLIASFLLTGEIAVKDQTNVAMKKWCRKDDVTVLNIEVELFLLIYWINTIF
jgi:hypothetical protein